MPVLCAYALPHPPLAVPAVGNGRENEIRETLSAFELAAEEIAGLSPETIVFITPHGTTYSDYFHISPGNRAKGDLSGFNAREVAFEVEYDADLAGEITRLAGKSGIAAGGQGEKKPELDHGVTVPLYFINRRFKNYKLVRISQSGMDPAEHYRLGRIIAEAAENLRRKTVLIASGDLSHKLSADGPYGFAREGAEFDGAVRQALADGDFPALFNIPDNLRECAAECGYNSYMVLAGCFDRHKTESRLLSYEAPFGVGYAAAKFSRGEPDSTRDFLEQYTQANLKDARRRADLEDGYRSLARKSLEFTVKTGDILPLPPGLPAELTENKAGVFVSIHKNGRLRGCVGTISPATGSIALEIIRNAVSAGLRDNRFEPVSARDLPALVYKVDVLSAPEPIAGPEELDVKRYGVIVSSGNRRGLLLPNLDGVDTVDAQIDIAKRKAGIAETTPSESIKLERFEVVRYE